MPVTPDSNSLMFKVRSHLAAHPDVIHTAQDVAKALNHEDVQTIRLYLGRLFRQGRAYRPQENQYQANELTDPGDPTKTALERVQALIGEASGVLGGIIAEREK